MTTPMIGLIALLIIALIGWVINPIIGVVIIK